VPYWRSAIDAHHWCDADAQTLNGTISRKLSTRQAPAPAESATQRQYQYHYQQQQGQGHHRQQRLAAHRTSCQPTLHSNASIAAQMRGMKTDEQETAETFFMT
jgi:cytochrome c-type biogenesis protein CcmH/NrfF